jgi:hypothetical protein
MVVVVILANSLMVPLPFVGTLTADFCGYFFFCRLLSVSLLSNLVGISSAGLCWSSFCRSLLVFLLPALASILPC